MAKNQIGWKFDNTYSSLPNYMLSKINPVPVKNPEIAIFNHNLSKDIDLDFSKTKEEEIASIFSGNNLPEGVETISQAYAGHQFGYFTILGDGRAHMIGEHITKSKKRLDIQFKGSGQTPYSRNGDGRAALGPMLREYLISESMFNMGIPTTRSLAVIKTGEDVLRETNLKGAILTRVASSHIRVGTFQYALVSKDQKILKALFEYTINRHYPKLKDSLSPALDLLKVVLDKQVELICNWMRVGFIHGVMNTDNMTISGETIDYGPCAFMDTYDPDTVFSSIDKNGRYSYFNQPRIAKWNLERFAECLIPLIDSNSKKSIKIAMEVLEEFPKKYRNAWLKMMKKKLGLFGENNNDEELIMGLMTWMHKHKADYTNTFCHLMKKLKLKEDVYKDQELMNWKKKWIERSKLNNNSFEKSLDVMKKFNPIIIPRNNIVEEALKVATKNNNFSKLKELLDILRDPTNKPSLIPLYQSPGKGEKYITYCGT